jgi:hypothetical protein
LNYEKQENIFGSGDTIEKEFLSEDRNGKFTENLVLQKIFEALKITKINKDELLENGE